MVPICREAVHVIAINGIVGAHNVQGHAALFLKRVSTQPSPKQSVVISMAVIVPASFAVRTLRRSVEAVYTRHRPRGAQRGKERIVLVLSRNAPIRAARQSGDIPVAVKAVEVRAAAGALD